MTGQRVKYLSRVVATCLVVAVPATVARADRTEFYSVLGYEPGVTHFGLGSTGSGAVTRLTSLGVTGAVYYGLTNSWHVGARLRYSAASDVHVSNAMVAMPGGSTAGGDVYQDYRSLGLGGMVLYRLDTHRSVAPLLELEAGVERQQFRRVALVPDGDTHFYPQPERASTVLYGSAALLIEYRFATRWVVAAGILGQREFSGDTPWAVRIPLRVAAIW
jgi:hypothetical protein